MKMKKIMQIEEGFTPPRSVEPIDTKSNPTIIFLSIQNIQCNLKHAFLVLCKAPVFKIFTFPSAISRYLGDSKVSLVALGLACIF